MGRGTGGERVRREQGFRYLPLPLNLLHFLELLLPPLNFHVCGRRQMHAQLGTPVLLFQQLVGRQFQLVQSGGVKGDFMYKPPCMIMYTYLFESVGWSAPQPGLSTGLPLRRVSG